MRSRLLSNSLRLISCVALVLGIIGAGAWTDRLSAAQTAQGPAGHWVGTLTGPGIEMEIDLESKGGVWRGTISVPSQGTKGIPLSDVSVKGKVISFGIKGPQGDPHYAGTISDDGKTITGTFDQGGNTLPLVLAWKGEAKFEVAQKSTAITKEMEGTWEGPLDVNGQVLRLRVILANAAGGATATLVSVDQANAEIPVATVTQDGSRLKLIISIISGSFDGELKGDALSGTWAQGPLSLPLTFKRVVK